MTQASARATRTIRAAHLLAAIAALAALSAGAAGPAERAADFDTLWRAIDTSYAYFDGEAARAAWNRSRNALRARARDAATQRALVAALEGALAALHEPHAALAQRTPDSPRRIPSETDIWARWKDGAARVEAVRIYGDADAAGLRPGDIVTRVQDIDVEQAVRRRVGEGASAARRDEALRELLAGPRFGVLKLEIRDERGVHPIAIERTAARPAREPALLARRVGDERDLGYLRLRDGAGDGLVAELDNALGYLRDTRGLIVDLRETSGPAARATTRAILARFAVAGTPWQVREMRNRRRVTDTVPEGPRPYSAPVVVLTDRWTEGEAEALAAGLHEAARARLVGTPSAGMRGELRTVVLPGSRIVARFPAERTLLLDGTPREALRPEIPVDLAAPSGGPGDPILYQALKAFDGR